MGWEHEAETVWKAQELYCVDRLSFERVADLVGVAASTLKRWSEKYDWRNKREEIAQAEAEIRMNTIRGRKAILEQLINAKDGKEASQVAFAVSALESLALKQQELALSGKIPTTADPKKLPVIKTRADAVTALKQAVEVKLGFALANPEAVTSAAVDDVVKCLKLVDVLQSTMPRDEIGDAEKGGVSGDLAHQLYKAMGVEI